RAGIRGDQQRNVVIAALVELELQRDRREEVRNAAPVGADLDQQPVRPGIDAAAAQVGNPPLDVRRQRARAQGHADTGGRFPRGDVEDVGRDGCQLAHNPTRSSGLTGARRSSRPVALRSAATTAAGTTTVDGSPTPLAPYGSPGSGSSTSSQTTGGMSRMVGSR